MLDQYVFHITKWYPNLDDDLEGIFIKRHIESTQLQYNSVVFYARSTSIRNDGHLFLLQEEQSGNNFTYIGYYNKKVTGISIVDKGIKLILYFYIMHRFLRDAINRFGAPVILHAHVLLRPALFACWLSYKLKVPYVITEHSTFFVNTANNATWRFKNLLRRFVVRRAKAIITVSKDLEQGMKNFSLFNNKYVCIFNCVNTNLFAFRPKTDYVPINLLHISEFKDEHKNIIGLLEVINKLKRNYFQFLFHLVGYGKDLEKILMYIKDNNLSDCVLFHGKLEEEQLSVLYTSADAFILFSNKENMPCVIAESLCCGTPVISTNVGGIPEVVNEYNGILIEKANQFQLYEAISDIIKRKSLFDYQKISEDSLQLFSFESIGIRIAKVYRESFDGNK